jgi:hypothetical protein
MAAAVQITTVHLVGGESVSVKADPNDVAQQLERGGDDYIRFPATTDAEVIWVNRRQVTVVSGPAQPND